MTPPPNDMRPRLLHYRSLLSTFQSSPSPLSILHSLPSPPPTAPPQTLLTLDSSFNPPTRAHLRLCTTALASLPASASASPPRGARARILLLLATSNADKAPKPASFEERLCMMEVFAAELLARISSSSSSASASSPSTSTTPSPDPNSEAGGGGGGGGGGGVGIDIAVTKHPYFVDKSAALAARAEYRGAEQVHLVGYDTLVRLLDTKYYPPAHTLASLRPFLERHRLLVTYRTGDRWGGRGEQDDYVRGIAEGSLDGVAGRREWVTEGRVRMVEGRGSGEVVSSTRVREVCKRRDKEALGGLVTEGVAEWVLERGLYVEDD